MVMIFTVQENVQTRYVFRFLNSESTTNSGTINNKKDLTSNLSPELSHLHKSILPASNVYHLSSFKGASKQSAVYGYNFGV